MKLQTTTFKFTGLALAAFFAVAVHAGIAQGPQGHDDHGRDNRGQDQQNRGNDFHFRDQDRGQFQSHYQRDVNKWRRNSHGRPQFVRGQRVPANYHFQAVPSSYYRGAPPPPPGYRYGYYDGYVVAYDPTTRIIGDVLDLVTAAAR